MVAFAADVVSAGAAVVVPNSHEHRREMWLLTEPTVTVIEPAGVLRGVSVLSRRGS